MQIVIDIPDKVLARIRSRHGHCGSVRHGNGIWTDDLLTVSTAIYFGKILPKGHGRLIDADALKKEAVMCPTAGNAETLLLDIGDVEHAPTIIEADKEVDE